MINSIWSKICQAYSTTDSFISKVGKWKSAAILICMWSVYFIVGRCVLGFSADILAGVTKATLSMVPIAILAVPYIAAFVLLAVSIIYAVNVFGSKKEG